MAGGRPSKYKKEYCEQLLEHGKKGLSLETFAGQIGVDRDTLKEWAKKHKEFSAAKKKFEDLSQFVWEQYGIAGMVGKIKGFNAAVWIFNMKNRFSWRDKREITIDDPPKDDNESTEDLLSQLED
jgi:hypothetical protein